MRFRSQKTWVISQKSMSYESKVHELRVKSLWVTNQKSMSYDFNWFQSSFNKKTLTQCYHNVYSVYRCICFCISVGQNLLFTSLQISVEPYFLNFRMLFPKLITDYRPTNDRLVTDIVNISESVTPLYSYTSTIYAK